MAAFENLTCCLAALGNDFEGSICAQKYLTKLISEEWFNDLQQKKVSFVDNYTNI